MLENDRNGPIPRILLASQTNKWHNFKLINNKMILRISHLGSTLQTMSNNNNKEWWDHTNKIHFISIKINLSIKITFWIQNLSNYKKRIWILSIEKYKIITFATFKEER